MGGDKAWECSGRLEPGAADPLASTFPGEDLAGIQLPEPPGIGPAHKGGALRVVSLPNGEGEGEGRGSIPGSRRYWGGGGGGRFVTQDAAPASRAAACSPGI